jgi:hypothetical protein
MAKVLGVVGDTVGEVVGASWLGSLVLGGVIIGVAASPEMRQRLRKWGVQGIAAAMAAGDMAAKRMRNAGDGTSGVANQLGQRIVQAVSELHEEWQDFLAEARTAKTRATRSSGNGARQADTSKNEGASGSAGRRRRASKPRSRRSPS